MAGSRCLSRHVEGGVDWDADTGRGWRAIADPFQSDTLGMTSAA